ncbi:MAG: cobalamin B12-binding domain-containing protein [Desulfobacterales bacterium]|nr:cobalamin B12-binding domain-containing protein [Desulfobacterales bacterium]
MFHVKHSPYILLINPWTTDFAAYNFWIRPLGLLFIASLLRANGFRVTLIDCLDFYSKTKKYGDGKFFKTKIQKPPPIKSIPKNYSQYGIPEEMLLKRLSFLEEKPDLIGITSGMTYWYPGVFKVIEITKNLFQGVL